jgi:hypothetical protein
MTSCLIAIIGREREVRILGDAFDECRQWNVLWNFLARLVESRCPSLRLLFTSRPEREIEDVVNALCIPNLDLRTAMDEDISRFVVETLRSSARPAFCYLPDDAKDLIKESLVSRAGGMCVPWCSVLLYLSLTYSFRFRWVSLQMDALRHCRSMGGLRRTLHTLPKTLDETYRRILDQIDEDYQPVVHRILQCICFSYHPLSVEDLGHIYHIGNQLQPPFEVEDALFRPTDVVDLCHGLLCIVVAQGYQWTFGVDEIQIVQLSHFSVKEYLFSLRAMSWRVEAEAAHLNIITVVIACYLASIMSSGNLTWWYPSDVLRRKRPLAMYTMQYLSWHLSALNPREHPNLIPSFQRLLDPTPSTLNRRIGMAWLCFKGIRETGEPIPPLKVSTLVIAVHLGLPLTCQWLLSLNPLPQIDTLTKVYDLHTPFLVHAAEENHVHVIEVLLYAGADVNQQDEWGVTAVYAASRSGHINAVKTLLHANARTDLTTSGSHWQDYSTPLHIAASRGHSSIVQMLIGAGADVDAGPSCIYTPLQIAAAENGNEETILALLRAGANINAESGGLGTPLVMTAMRGFKDGVQILLDARAKVNKKPRGCGLPALHTAVCRGHREIVEMLLNAGADVNMTSHRFGTPIDEVERVLEDSEDHTFGDDDGHVLQDIVKVLFDAGGRPSKWLRDSSHSGSSSADSEGE